MKRTGLFDRHSDEIVEGDSLQIILTKEEKSGFFYYYNIKKIILEVLDSEGSIGVKVKQRFYKKTFFGKEKQFGTHQQYLNFQTASKAKNNAGELITKKSYIERITKEDSKLSDFIENTISSIQDIYSFSSTLSHPSIEIIKRKVDGQERDLLLSKPTDLDSLTIMLENGQIIDPKKQLLIELSEESIKYAKERSSISFDSYSVEGDFTGLIASLKTLSDSEHSYSFAPCNNDKEHSYFKISMSNDKKKVITDLFISFTSSVDVLNMLLNQGSRITEI